jgi:hypothetical protein
MTGSATKQSSLIADIWIASLALAMAARLAQLAHAMYRQIRMSQPELLTS